MMKKTIGLTDFCLFQSPCDVQSQGEDLYFLLKQPDLAGNRYTSDLYRYRCGQVDRLTASGDVNSYCLLGKTIIFPALRQEADRKAVQSGQPLTVFQRLQEGKGEALELFRLPMQVSGIRFVDESHALLTARYDAAWARSLAQAQGDAVEAARLQADEADYRVFDEVPFWSNGEGIVNGVRDRLYWLDQGVATPLTDEATTVTEVVLSPGKTRAVLIAQRYTQVAPYANELLLVDLTTLAVTNVTPLPETTYEAAVFADEQTLVVAAIRGQAYGINENPGLYRVNLRDQAATPLYEGGAYSLGSSVGCDIRQGGSSQPPLWVQGDKVHFITTQGEQSVLMACDLTGGEPQALRQAEGAVFEACPMEGGIALAALRGLKGMELYRLQADGEEAQLTHFNDAIAAEYEQSQPRPLSFVNEAGVEVHGFVLPPVGMETGKTYPAILDIHGGPKTVYGAGFFHEMQAWAARGYAVLYCNPTGSDGRGNAFADIRGRYGTVDYRDLMTFVDRALEAFNFLDAQRLGVTGGSYGGFMTNWIIGHTDRFRCAASQRSIANWVSFYGTTDIGYFFGPDQNAATPWDDFERVWAQSPLRYADRVKTPTLFIHSDEDYRCWMAEGLQMYTALRTHGVPARLCLFRGENHELSRSGKPTHRVRRLEEITRWMDQYLQAACEKEAQG